MAGQTIPAQFTGSRGFLGLATETSFNVAVASTDYVEIDTDDSLEAEPGNTPIETIRHTRAAVSHFIQTGTWIEGGWSNPLWNTQGIRALAAALGQDWITSVAIVISGGAGTFTITCGANTTGALAWNAAGATVQTAVQGLASVGSGNAMVSLVGTTYTITWAGTLVPSPTVTPPTTTTTGTGGATATAYYTHFLSRREDGLPSLTIEKALGGTVNPGGTPIAAKSLQYAGCLFDTMELIGAVNAATKATYKVMGATQAIITQTTPAFVADQPFTVANTIVTMSFADGNTYPENSPSVIPFICTAWQTKLNNNVQKELAYWGQRYPALIYGGESKVDGKLSVLVTDPALSLYLESINGILGNLTVAMVGSGQFGATLQINNLMLGKFSQPLKIGRNIIHEVPFTDALAIGASTDISVSVTNTKSTPYV